MNGLPARTVFHCERALQTERRRLGNEGEASDERFRQFVHRQSRFVFRVAYAVLRSVYDAEDVVQETFFKLYRTGTWKAIRDERAFLARTAWRLAVDRLANRIHDLSHDEIDSAKLASIAPTPEQSAIAEDSRALVQKLIDSLPEDLRQPLALSTLEEMSSPEIAAVMGIPEGTVRTRLMRARAMLKEKLVVVMDGRHAK